jgi:glutamate--cysteine ligase
VPSKTRQLGLPDARTLIVDCGFGGNGDTPFKPSIGVELESFTVPVSDPARLPRPPLPAGSRLSFEPGGQVEISSLPANTVAEACDAISTDLTALSEAFSQLGVQLIQRGLSTRPPHRLVDGPRYRAMEAYFDSAWPEGRRMMCTTAAVQVNLSLADGRWEAANALGPVLAAGFANSRLPGWANGRLATWLALDPSRTAPVNGSPLPSEAWVNYALAARIMFIRVDDGHYVNLDGPLTAGEWVRSGHPLGWPTADDLAYHLTTLFPPVRPKRWLELRMIDSLPDPWWRVPVAVAAALVDDDVAVEAASSTINRWRQAATAGLADPVIGQVARVITDRALAGLDRVGADDCTAQLTEQWADAVLRGRSMPWI